MNREKIIGGIELIVGVLCPVFGFAAGTFYAYLAIEAFDLDYSVLGCVALVDSNIFVLGSGFAGSVFLKDGYERLRS